MSEEKRIHRRLEEVFREAAAEEKQLDLDSARWVIFSDQHKGQRDSADDFRGCRRSYHAALEHYLEKGYTLMALGDVEELWECRPKKVVAAYKDSLELESKFHKADRYQRFSGNHDDQWESRWAVKRYLHPIFPDLAVKEGARFRVTKDGEVLGTLFLAHGHQGTNFNDRNAEIAKFFVRNIWRPVQRLFKIRSASPAKDFELRAKHDCTMHQWAADKDDVVMVVGHTHRPVFMSKPLPGQVEHLLEQARSRLEAEPTSPRAQEQVTRFQAELEWVEAHREETLFPSEDADEERSPCYFNSGCCCFCDGEVTGLEIADGKIRLVRWPADDSVQRPEILASADLKTQVFETLH